VVYSVIRDTQKLPSTLPKLSIKTKKTFYMFT